MLWIVYSQWGRIKTHEDRETIYEHLRKGVYEQYGIETIVNRYMDSIEYEVNIPQLITFFNESVRPGIQSIKKPC
jgi:hypothetical protein